MQVLKGIKVYVLLLNVDFIPVFGEKDLPEWMEFLFQLVISCVIGVVFVYMMERQNVTGKGSWILSLVLTVPTVFLYFPLSHLAIKDVPGFMYAEAIILWTAGHLLYVVKSTKRKKLQSHS
ncbi:hypothetical protein F0342_23830 [Bacillus sp. CH30_1T]|uniref:hypothetical protein n=1 Tax=Bacillus sp. CH30_1T TaxID=2604836 RepID=UPI0011ECEFDC|nr:hypothetical protein [Bacillus sp. CH30_1T]KAA0560221.1 hypothetical protein F0342_23830 [Bacillus sp. CH30_1T]